MKFALTTHSLYVVPEFPQAVPELRHVVGDGVVVHEGAREVAAALARVQGVHDDVAVTAHNQLTHPIHLIHNF